MYLTETLHIHSGKVRTRARSAGFRTRSIPFLLAFTLALANGICFADQTDPSAGSQSEINKAQAAYGAGTCRCEEQRLEEQKRSSRRSSA
jgi:hypothetical protein